MDNQEVRTKTRGRPRKYDKSDLPNIQKEYNKIYYLKKKQSKDKSMKQGFKDCENYLLNKDLIKDLEIDIQRSYRRIIELKNENRAIRESFIPITTEHLQCISEESN